MHNIKSAIHPVPCSPDATTRKAMRAAWFRGKLSSDPATEARRALRALGRLQPTHISARTRGANE